MKRLYKQSRQEQHHKTERHLRRDQHMHRPPSRVRLVPALQRTHWLHRRSTQCRNANPNSSATASDRSNPNPSTRQSAGRISCTGLSGGLILLTTNGAAHHANASPRPAAIRPSMALSTMTIFTSRHRPAPIETRSAISRPRAAACADMRLATFAHATNSTITTSAPNA